MAACRPEDVTGKTAAEDWHAGHNPSEQTISEQACNASLLQPCSPQTPVPT